MSNDELHSSMGGKAPVTLSQYKSIHPPPDSEYSDSFDSDDDQEETMEERVRRLAIEAVHEVSMDIAREAAREAVRVYGQKHPAPKPKKRPAPSAERSTSPSARKRRRHEAPFSLDLQWDYPGRVVERLEVALKETHKQREYPRKDCEWISYAESMGDDGTAAILDRNAWNTASRMMTYIVDEAILQDLIARTAGLEKKLRGIPLPRVVEILASCSERKMSPRRLRLILGEELWASTGLAAAMPDVAMPDMPPTPQPPETGILEDFNGPEPLTPAPPTEPPSPVPTDDPLGFDETPADARAPSPLPRPNLPAPGELRVMGPPTGLPEPPPAPTRPTHAPRTELAATAE